MNQFRRKIWSPYLVGALIGVLSWFAFASADHQLGITTAFEYTAALAEKGALPGAERNDSYYAAKAAEHKSPRIDWEWMLVLGVFIGASASSRFSGDRPKEPLPPLWRRRFGESLRRRYLGAFCGGVLMMFGARVAQGCTSGHAISGVLQLALSSWLFAPVMFAAASATAFLIYGRDGRNRV